MSVVGGRWRSWRYEVKAKSRRRNCAHIHLVHLAHSGVRLSSAAFSYRNKYLICNESVILRFYQSKHDKPVTTAAVPSIDNHGTKCSASLPKAVA